MINNDDDKRRGVPVDLIEEDNKDFAKRLASANKHISTQSSSSSILDHSPGSRSPAMNEDDYSSDIHTGVFNSSSGNKKQPNILREFDSTFDLPEFNNSSSEDYHRFISLKRTGTIVKASAILLLLGG
eukprot:gene12853-15095_t